MTQGFFWTLKHFAVSAWIFKVIQASSILISLPSQANLYEVPCRDVVQLWHFGVQIMDFSRPLSSPRNLSVSLQVISGANNTLQPEFLSSANGCWPSSKGQCESLGYQDLYVFSACNCPFNIVQPLITQVYPSCGTDGHSVIRFALADTSLDCLNVIWSL